MSETTVSEENRTVDPSPSSGSLRRKQDRTARSGSSGKREARAGMLFTLPFALGFFLVFIIPICVAVYQSFFRAAPKGGGAYGGGELVKQFVGLDNFKEVVQNERFWAGMGRVFVYGALQIPIMIIAALLLAIMIDSLVIKHVSAFRLGNFLPYAIPGVVAAMLWMYLYTPEISPIVKGLASIGIHVDFMAPNFILASMANMTTWTYTGYNMLIFLAALQSIPKDLQEAARLDGASGWQIVWHIKVPLVRGAALLAVLLSIIGTVQLFNEPMILEVSNQWMGKDYTPMMLAYNTMMGALSPSGDGPGSAASIVMALVAALLAAVYALAQRRTEK